MAPNEDPITAFALKLAEEKGWSQDEFAQRIGAEDRQTVNNWKRRGMPPKRYRAVAQVLGLTVEQLIAGKPGKGPREPAQRIYGFDLTYEAAAFAADWMALTGPTKAQFQALVQTLLQQQARDNGSGEPAVVDRAVLQRRQRR